MKVGICSLRGSPGVTTLATLLVALWPSDVSDDDDVLVVQPRQLLIEADLDGGSSLLARYPAHLAREPNLTTLAAASRHGFDEEATWRQTQKLPGIGDVIVGAEHPNMTFRALKDLRVDQFDEAMPSGVVSIWDLGRLRNQNQDLAKTMDLLLVVASATYEGVEPLLTRRHELAALSCPTGVVLVGDGPISEAELTEALNYELTVLGHITKADADARVWNADPTKMRPLSTRRWLNNSVLLADARKLTDVVVAATTEVNTP